MFVFLLKNLPERQDFHVLPLLRYNILKAQVFVWFVA
jgi:hypothetical protein